MKQPFRKLMRKLSKARSGNAAMLVALGLPALIGSGGLAVDVAQWFIWKRELQFAVDQAAIAGAWARADSTTINNYQVRSLQEFNSNLQVTEDFAASPVIELVDHDGGIDNAVQVTASATRALPFSNIFLEEGVTVRVTARALLNEGGNWSGCIVALHPTAEGAFTLGGNASGNATCGTVALSNDPDAAMVKNGNSTAQLGQLVATGGIDADFAVNGTMHPFTAGLTNPFADSTEPDPDSSPSRTYSCPTASAGTTVTTGDKSTTTTITYLYVRGNNSNQALNNAQNGTNSYSYSPVTAGSTDTASESGVALPNGTAVGTVNGAPKYTYVRQVMNSPKVHEVKKTVTNVTYSNVTTTTTGASDGIARPLPGTYSTINIACATEFPPGIYLIDDIDFGQNHVVTGDGVLFVIRNAGGMHINSQSVVTLTGISKDMLMNTYGYSEADASKMARMVIYDEHTTEQFKLNGNADVFFFGTIYMPNREIWFNGTATATGKCMMLIASQITFTGTIDLNNFCVPTGATIPNAGGSAASVRLVV
jgi:Flp pilus assembly protein TadG